MEFKNYEEQETADIYRQLSELKEICMMTNQLLIQQNEKITSIQNVIDDTRTEVKIAQNQISKVEEIVTKPSFLTSAIKKLSVGAIMGVGVGLLTGGSLPLVMSVGAGGYYLISKIV